MRDKNVPSNYLVNDHGLVGELHERFRHAQGQRPESGPEPTDQDESLHGQRLALRLLPRREKGISEGDQRRKSSGFMDFIKQEEACMIRQLKKGSCWLDRDQVEREKHVTIYPENAPNRGRQKLPANYRLEASSRFLYFLH